MTGLYVSYWYDASPGGLVVLCQGCAFTIAYLFSPHHGLLNNILKARRRDRRTDVSAAAHAGGGET